MRPPGKILENVSCINEECSYYNQPGSMVEWKNKKIRKDNKLFHCRECGKNYTAAHGTIFLNKKTDPEKIVQVLLALSEGNSIRGCERLFGHTKDTVIRWLVEAGQHCAEVEKILMNKFDFNQVQIDELWTFIEKKTTRKLVRKEQAKQKPSN